MDFRGTLTLPPATRLALSEHLRKTGASLSLEQASIAALDEWLAEKRSPDSCPAALRGYQWKELFLPDGTDVRMIYDGHSHYAKVRDDQLLYEGRAVSPRAFTMRVAAGVRNAWRDLWLRFPGKREWQRALLLRQAQAQRAQHGQAPPPSPADTIAAAAACMSDALHTALALVDHASALAVPKFERRQERHRRTGDILCDD
jgi:hypothetical protein